VGSRTIVATARRMEDVAVAFYLDEAVAVGCGPRTPPEIVFLTWRITRAAEAQTNLVGQAVALEFVPRDYMR
jgi:hypothetical protein